MQPDTQLPRNIAYERAVLAMNNAAVVVPQALAQALEGVVLVLDIAQMSTINARHGLAAGDRVLSDIERMLQQEFSEFGWVVRLPGDQFVVVLPREKSTDLATLSARQALERVHLRRRWRRRTMVTAHIGAARWNDSSSRQSVVRTASNGLKSTSA